MAWTDQGLSEPRRRKWFKIPQFCGQQSSNQIPSNLSPETRIIFTNIEEWELLKQDRRWAWYCQTDDIREEVFRGEDLRDPYPPPYTEHL